jgi:excisionase family DNA binding protein
MDKYEVYTTGQVAQICRVAPRTVTKWFDNGQLKGYRIPGSKDRRIPAGELMRFMRANHIPVDGMELGIVRILLIDTNIQWLEQICGELNRLEKYRSQWADNMFDVGFAANKLQPHVVIVNLMSNRLNAIEICKNIHAKEDLQGAKVVAIAPNLSCNEQAALIEKGFDNVIAGEVNFKSIAGAIEDATNLFH